MRVLRNFCQSAPRLGAANGVPDEGVRGSELNFCAYFSAIGSEARGYA